MYIDFTIVSTQLHITFSNIIYSEVVLSEQYIMVKARPTVSKTQSSNETENFY